MKKNRVSMARIIFALFVLVDLIICCYFITAMFKQYTFVYAENNRKALYTAPTILVVCLFALSIAYLTFLHGKKGGLTVFLLIAFVLNAAIFDCCLSTKNTKYTYSYTDDLTNYGKYDTILVNSNKFDVSFFPTDLQGQNVKKFSYYFDCYDCINYELFLQIKMNDSDSLKEYAKNSADTLNYANEVKTLKNIDIYFFSPDNNGENLNNKYADAILINKEQCEIVFVSVCLPNQPFGNHVSEYNKYLLNTM